MTDVNFEAMAEKMSARAQEIADTLLPLENEMPNFISKLSPLGRFIAVGALWQAGELPHQEIATALLFDPEHVHYGTAANYEDAMAAMEAVAPREGHHGVDFVTTPDGDTSVTEFGSMVRMAEHGDVDVQNTDRDDDETPLAEWERELLNTVTTEPTTTYDDIDHEIYAAAREIIAEHPEFEAEVVRATTAAGLDWPQGSGDYHGGVPFAQMTEIDRMRALVEVYGIVDRVLAQSRSNRNAA